MWISINMGLSFPGSHVFDLARQDLRAPFFTSNVLSEGQYRNPLGLLFAQNRLASCVVEFAEQVLHQLVREATALAAIILLAA